MNQPTPQERELVALGAAMGSNCTPCINHHISLARQLGLTDFQIREAIELADQIRQVPARSVLKAATQELKCAGQKGGFPDAVQCRDLSKHSSQCC